MYSWQLEITMLKRLSMLPPQFMAIPLLYPRGKIGFPYALTKLVGKYYGYIFQRIYDLTTIYLRYFNVYGPRQSLDLKYAAVIPIFIARVSQNKHPII